MYFSKHMDELISVDEDGKRVRGLYGDHMFKPIANPKGRFFKCQLVGEYFVGTRQPNGSFDGAIGLLERGVSSFRLPESQPEEFFQCELTDLFKPQLIDAYMKVLNPLLSGECDKIQLTPPLNEEE